MGQCTAPTLPVPLGLIACHRHLWESLLGSHRALEGRRGARKVQRSQDSFWSPARPGPVLSLSASCTLGHWENQLTSAQMPAPEGPSCPAGQGGSSRPRLGAPAGPLGTAEEDLCQKCQSGHTSHIVPTWGPKGSELSWTGWPSQEKA